MLAVLVFFEDEGFDLAVFDGAGPDDDEVGECGVADPTLLAVYDPFVALTTRCRLQHYGVRPVVRPRKAPGPDLLHPRHLGEPPSFLLLLTAYRHGPHREPGMDPEERVQATVPTRHLDGDQPCRNLAHSWTPVLLDGSTRNIQCGDLGY